MRRPPAARSGRRRRWQRSSYRLRTVRFAAPTEHASAYDDLGATAAETVRNTLRALDDPALCALWEEVHSHA